MAGARRGREAEKEQGKRKGKEQGAEGEEAEDGSEERP
jgi:hypothetical protein